ncbi:MAG: hypothetical protein WCG28_02830 [bacterium]
MKLKVLKFGGGVVYDASSIKLFVKRVSEELKPNTNLVIVLSAFGKTTNNLEDLTKAFFKHSNDEDISGRLQRIKNFHINIAEGLFPNNDMYKKHAREEVFKTMIQIEEIGWTYRDHFSYDLLYDQIVSSGEKLSSFFCSLLLKRCRLRNELVDACELIITDSNFRNAKVNMNETTHHLTEKLCGFFQEKRVDIATTQGFIGSCYGNLYRFKTTLGREGSDYSAAIFATALSAKEVILYKNVPGIMDKDPNVPGGEDAKLIENLTYKRCEELLHGTAKGIIFPEAVNLLKSAKIPLRIKSFENPGLPGTLIS